jgi:plasmid stabilization system protein ParE
MSRFVLTPAARADLTEIFDYISRDNPNAARRVLDELRSAMRKLSEPVVHLPRHPLPYRSTL